MASHQIAIAKASFAASLLRPDPTSVPRSEVDQFHSLLNSVTVECSPENVQKCKRWILTFIVPSQKRCESLGKYLLALSTSFIDIPKPAQQLSSSTKNEVSAKRRRLHILYLIHDLAHHTKVRGDDTRVATALEPVLGPLFSLAAQGKGVKHGKKLDRLLHLWSARDYFPSPAIDALRDAVRDARKGAGDSGNVKTGEDKVDSGKEKREQPYDLPATHGDYNTAWYDLPAANLMQHIIPNSTKPIKGSMVQPLQFQPGPAGSALVDAVKNLIMDSKKMYGEDDEEEGEKYDVDELGQHLVKDEFGTRKIKETYYGWSPEFAMKMAAKKKGVLSSAFKDDRDRDDRAYSSDRSISRSRSRSRGGLGRGIGGNDGFSRGRRESFSGSSSRSRSRSPGQSRGYGGRGYGGGGGGGTGDMGPPRGRGSRSATPDMMPRGLGY